MCLQKLLIAPQGASHVTPNGAAASSVGASSEDVGSDGDAEAAPVRSKAVASVMADAPSTATDQPAKAPPPPGPDNPFEAMPCGSAQPATGSRREETLADDNVVVSHAELKEMKMAREESDRRIVRLEAQLLAAQDPKRHNKIQRGLREERARVDAQKSKRRRVSAGSEDVSSEEDDEGEAEEVPVRASVRMRRHMTVSSSPILQEALDFLPAGKLWKVSIHVVVHQKTCDHVREYLLIDWANEGMTFYPSSKDKTLGVCAITLRLTFNYAGFALATDKTRQGDLNKSLSQWKTKVTGRVRDIALPRIGLWLDDRDARSPWARKKRREAAEDRSIIDGALRLPMVCADDLTLSTWSESKSGMIFASGAFTACAVTAFQQKKVNGTVTVKLYQMAWLEHVVTDTILNWDKRKGRLSNSTGGNAQVVDGLHHVACML
ncbi:unnamed protein product [Closterium sp. Yama58-4]|nr:unnamed protein product [Closterium sp. Yama58-4]